MASHGCSLSWCHFYCFMWMHISQIIWIPRISFYVLWLVMVAFVPIINQRWKGVCVSWMKLSWIFNDHVNWSIWKLIEVSESDWFCYCNPVEVHSVLGNNCILMLHRLLFRASPSHLPCYGKKSQFMFTKFKKLQSNTYLYKSGTCSWCNIESENKRKS